MTFSMALGLAMFCSQARAQASIPKAHGTTLTGAAVALPDGLKGKTGVLVVGFSHGSQGQVAAWGRRLAAEFGQSAAVAYYEMPMIGGAPKMLRGMIVKSMGKSVPEVEQQHFLPITEDDKPWRAVAHYAKGDDAYVLLVAGNGTVLWQTEGDATDAAWADFKPRVDKLLAEENGVR